MAIDENSKTPGLPNLEQLIAEEKLERARQNEILDERSKKRKRNKLLIVIPMATVSVLLIGGIAVYDPFAQNFRWGEAGSKAKENSQTTEGTSGKPVGNGEWWEQKEKSFPVAVPPWAQVEAISNSSGGDETKNPPAADEDKPIQESSLDRFNRSEKLNGLYDEVTKSYYGQTISQVAGILPSREGGYTDDASKAVNADGSLNGDFSFWTREGFTAELGTMLNRLTNPVFGGWQDASEAAADNSTKDKLSDLFTSDWLNANEAEYLPIVTTAKAPVAVNYLPSGGVRWVGTINQGSENLVFNYDKGLKNYIVDYSADVTYSVWGSDQKVVSMPGKLTLKLVPNSNGQNVNSGNRVLISEASLTLG